ncbi:hypothetical protein FACS189429_1960 [Bacteroidia bacterium]|nr:hypothetical protein FACS189429_1960 [Bacteroidia bacterium]
MNKLHLITITFFVFCFFQTAKSQTVHFKYDAAGNCIEKYKTVTMPAPRAQSYTGNTQETDSVADEENASADNIIAVVEDIVGETVIRIYPNPTRGILQIEMQNKAPELPVTYTLTAVNGKYLTGGQSTDNPLLLDLSGFQSGVYLLRLTIDGKSETYKIIKQ